MNVHIHYNDETRRTVTTKNGVEVSETVNDKHWFGATIIPSYLMTTATYYILLGKIRRNQENGKFSMCYIYKYAVKFKNNH